MFETPRSARGVPKPGVYLTSKLTGAEFDFWQGELARWVPNEAETALCQRFAIALRGAIARLAERSVWSKHR